MNTILYDVYKKQWTHSEKQWKFGKNTVTIASPSKSISFSVQCTDERVGPLVGILTSRNKAGSLCGDWGRFTSIQKELSKRGGISFIFTPDGIRETTIDGHVLLENNTWRKLLFPYPDVVYNRIPYRTHEKSEMFQQTLALFTKHSIPIFNPHFFSKWDVHQALYSNVKLRRYLLPTIMLDSRKHFEELLHTYNTLFIKQCESAKGKHLFQMKKARNTVLVSFGNKHDQQMPIEEAWKLISNNFLAQPALLHDTIAGRKYDLRILVHYLSKQFFISGIGVRVAAPKHIVTHVHNGGEIISSTMLPRKIKQNILEEIVQQCGNSLCTFFGRIREFSIDIGIDVHGNYYIYECNAKPMMFDEIDIQTKAIQNIVTVFEQETGFK